MDDQLFAMMRSFDRLIDKRPARVTVECVARSDNREFKDLPINDSEPITIIGRAIWMGAKL